MHMGQSNWKTAQRMLVSGMIEATTTTKKTANITKEGFVLTQTKQTMPFNSATNDQDDEK